MSDVYSFGVVLLELITGRRTIDEKRPKREQNLVEWARHILKDPQKVDRLIDPRLEGDYSIEGAKIAASLVHRCLSRNAKSRPSMSNVVKILESLVDNDDYQSASFVYIVPNEREEEKVFDEGGMERVGKCDKGEEKESNWKSCIFYGHRLRSSKSRGAYLEI